MALMQTLRLFCDVVQHRSFSQAAAKHGITQSAASQRVGVLEKRLGVKLIDRSVRPLTLTEAGELFATECRELLDRYDRLEQRVSQLQSQLVGRVRVEAIYSAGIDLLQRVRDAFVREHAHVEVQIEYRPPAEVYDAVRGHRCDLGIVSYPQDWGGVSSIVLRSEVMAVVCAPSHPLADNGEVVQASQLAAWPMVTFEPNLPVGRHLRRYLREHGVVPAITHVFDNIDTIKSAVAVTDQVSILPQRTVLREVAAGTLSSVSLQPPLTRPLGIISHRRNKSNGAFSPAVQTFVDFLLEHAGPKVDLVDQTQTTQRLPVGDKV